MMLDNNHVEVCHRLQSDDHDLGDRQQTRRLKAVCRAVPCSGTLVVIGPPRLPPTVVRLSCCASLRDPPRTGTHIFSCSTPHREADPRPLSLVAALRQTAETHIPGPPSGRSSSASPPYLDAVAPDLALVDSHALLSRPGKYLLDAARVCNMC